MKKLIHISLICLLMILLPSLSKGEKPATTKLQDSLSLPQAYQLALQNNLDIQAAKAKIGEAKADILLAKMIPNPSFNSDLGFIAEQTYRIGGLQQTFEAPGKRHFRIEVAKDQYQSAEDNFELTLHNVLVKVHQAYINWIITLTQQNLQEENEQVLRSLVNIAQKRFKNGDVAQLDVLQSKMLLEQAQNDTEQAKMNTKQAKILLKQLLNTQNFSAPPSQQGLSLKTVHLAPLSQLEQEALTNRDELHINQVGLQSEKDKIKLYHRSILPDLTIGAGYSLAFNAPVWDNGFYVNGSFNIPIFDHQQGNIAKSKATYQRLLSERAAWEQQIKTEVQTSYQNVLSQQAQWQRYQKTILPMARQVEQLSQKSYQMGQTGITDVLTTHQNTLNIRKQTKQKLANYQLALTNLETALNILFNNKGKP